MDPLVGHCLQRDQGLRRARLAVERHDLDLLATEHAALGVHLAHSELHVVRPPFPDGGRRPAQRLDYRHPDRLGCVSGARRKRENATHHRMNHVNRDH